MDGPCYCGSTTSAATWRKRTGETLQSAAFMERCRDNGIKLNREKLQLRMSEVTFMGHRITKDGLKSAPEKAKAIAKMAAPATVEELR